MLCIGIHTSTKLLRAIVGEPALGPNLVGQAQVGRTISRPEFGGPAKWAGRFAAVIWWAWGPLPTYTWDFDFTADNEIPAHRTCQWHSMMLHSLAVWATPHLRNLAVPGQSREPQIIFLGSKKHR